ncbi:MAG TPA: VOC family protein [Anaerolineales bacterium]|nr:VOC family protein [Anaerolineales bacterium]
MSKRNIVHIEITANTPESSANFYQKLFGWKTQLMPEMNYYTWMPEEAPGGGFAEVSEINPVGRVLIYIDSPDINADLQAIEALGGHVIQPKTEIPGMGWFAIFKDPTDNAIGLFQSLPS